jgi:hypothetical protein
MVHRAQPSCFAIPSQALKKITITTHHSAFTIYHHCDHNSTVYHSLFTIYDSHMSAKLSVIFYIVLCLEIGIVLTLLPWVPQGTLGLSDWGNNYFLLYAARKTGLYGLQTVVASGWVRGAVTGVGLLNMGIAFWEIFHFKQTMRALQESTEPQSNSKNDADQTAPAAKSTHISDH